MNEETVVIDEQKIKDRIEVILETNPIVKMLKPLFKMRNLDNNVLMGVLKHLPEILVILSKDRRGLEILKETGILNEVMKE